MTVLTADDDPIMRKLIADILKKQGFGVLEAADGGKAIDLFYESKDIDLVILDVMMPVYDGWEVLKTLREFTDVPIIMLTALGDDRHEVRGLTRGADDYIAKPFSYEVLIARINALLRKTKRGISSDILIGDILIRQENHRVFCGNEEITLNNKEYLLLLYLVKNKNILLTRNQLLSGVWGFDFEGDSRTVDAHIKMLRKKLGSCDRYIQTLRGSGYIFEVTG